MGKGWMLTIGPASTLDVWHQSCTKRLLNEGVPAGGYRKDGNPGDQRIDSALKFDIFQSRHLGIFTVDHLRDATVGLLSSDLSFYDRDFRTLFSA